MQRVGILQKGKNLRNVERYHGWWSTVIGVKFRVFQFERRKQHKLVYSHFLLKFLHSFSVAETLRRNLSTKQCNAILHVPFKIFCVITWPHILLGFLHVNMARTRLKYVYRTRCDFVYITHVIEKQQLLYFSQNKQKVHLHTDSLESHVQRWISDWIKLSSLIGQWRKIWGNWTVSELPSVLTSSRKDLLALASSKRNSLAEPLRQIWQRNVHLCVCVFSWAIDEWAI